jgi:hemoglobin/transferrin/lactoferrin receptor protein
LLAGALAAGAQTGDAVAVRAGRAPDIVVTATRLAADAQTVPGIVYRLDGHRARTEQLARTTPDQLRGLPSTFVQKTGYGQGSPFLRGFTGFRTLCLVDGVRLNNSVFRDGPNQYWNTVDPASLRDSEVAMGSGSVLYGSDAVGGAMNAFPADVPEWEEGGNWDATLGLRASTADRSLVGRAQGGGRVSEAFGFLGGVSVKSFGDLRGGRDVGQQQHTGYGEHAVDLRADWFPAEDSELSVVHQSVRQNDAWRTHRTIYGIEWEGLKKGDDLKHSFDQARDLTYAKFGRHASLGFVDDLQVTVSRHAQSEDQYRLRKDSTGDRAGSDVTTWGAGVQLASETLPGTLVYGFEYYRDFVSSYSRKYKADGSFKSEDIQGPVADDSTYDSLGVYLQDTLALWDGRFQVTPGVRYSWFQADVGVMKDPATGSAIGFTKQWDAVAGSLRAVQALDADRRWALFAGVSQGFRAPNLSDLSRLDTARSNELETPSPDVEPERFVAGEAGLKVRTSRVRAQAAYYYTVIESLIVRTPTGRTIDERVEVTKQNGGDGYVQGVELSGAVTLGLGWSARLAAAWMDGEVDAYPTSSAVKERDALSRLMPPSAEAGMRWDRADGRCWVEGVCLAADKADQLSADDERDTQRIPPGGTPGYAVLSLRGGARLFESLTLSAGLDNLLDQDYRIHGSGVNEPGRSVTLAAEWRL